MPETSQEPESAQKLRDVAICVASYRRPEGLHALLGEIQRLRFPGAPPSLHVHVVDNDAAGSARKVVDDARHWFSHPISYVLEPRKGIPRARNATLRSAIGTARLLAFIDDDEIPCPGWLGALIETHEATGADVVTGPVVARFVEPPPDWVVEGAFFDPPRASTGQEMPVAYTNNVLVSADALTTLSSFFDESFTKGVGEDAELFQRLVAGGRRIVWCDEAVVYDQVPPERTKTRWLISRGFRIGTAAAYIERRHAPAGANLRNLLQSLRSLASGLLRAATTTRRARRTQGLQIAAMGIGRMAGMLGVR